MLIGAPAGRRSLVMPKRGWEDNSRIDLKEIGISTRNWVDSTQDRNDRRTLVNSALNLRVP